MDTFKKKRLARDRIKWAVIFLICFVMVSILSPNSLNKNLSYFITNPIELLKTEQENPIRYIFTKLFTPEIPDRFKEWR
ncbi:hypothetical protein [Aquiflexum sp.]|uniref:hypothetical protein n=1 Tax=Aquiflexum sp. TaxID=1872584 RepID=UPI003594388B